MTDLDAMFHRTQELLSKLRRHRGEISHETSGERAARQEARAHEVLRGLVGHRRVSPAMRRWARELVDADERPDPPGDPIPPKSPGARAVLKPKKRDPIQDELW